MYTAAPYKVTEGDLPSIDNAVSGTNGEICTDISLGSLTISESTTLGAFSRAVINSNPDRFVNGDQITVFVATQTSNGVTGLPYVAMKTAKIKLDVTDNETLLSEFDPDGMYFAVTPGKEHGHTAAAYTAGQISLHEGVKVRHSSVAGLETGSVVAIEQLPNVHQIAPLNTACHLGIGTDNTAARSFADFLSCDGVTADNGQSCVANRPATLTNYN